MDFWNLFENPTFMFVFNEIVCILGDLYYLGILLHFLGSTEKMINAEERDLFLQKIYKIY